MQNLSLLLVLIITVSACSLRGADVHQQLSDLNDKADRYQFDATYMLGTKKLRDKNPTSLTAHAGYIHARRGSKAMMAEYASLAQKKKSPLFDYLALRAKLTGVGYREMAKRNELVDKMEKLALANESIKEEALYDLCTGFYLLRDKKKIRNYAELLLKKKPNFLPYKQLMSRVLVPHDEAKKIVSSCEEGLKGSRFDLGLCVKIRELNEENAKGLVDKRNALLEKMVVKSFKKRSKLSSVWEVLHSLSEAGDEKARALKEKLVQEALSKDTDWLPREVYRKYYGDIDYSDFEFILQIAAISKELDFKKRVADFEGLLKSQNGKMPSKKRQAQVLSSLGLAYLNPANSDKEKAFKFLIQANEYEPLSSYSTMMLLDLILDLKKDPDIGLMIVEDRLETSLEESEKMSLESSKEVGDFFKYSKMDKSSLHNFRGRLFLEKGQKDKARLSFLESFQFKETETAAYYLGELYQESNPMVAIDFLALSLKHRSEKMPMKDELSKKRDQLLTKLYKKFFSRDLDKEQLLALYDNQQKEEGHDAPHAFVGKPLVTDKVADFKGGDYDWAKLKGKKVILSFWATWCTPCFQEMAVLNKIQKEGKIKDLKIVGVCTDGLEQKKKVKKILKNGGIEFDILLDDGTFKNKYLVAAIPSMFFLNEQGQFIKQKTGYSPELEKEILKLFKE